VKGRAALAAFLLVFVCGASGSGSGSDKEKEPFYRKYLIPGDPLDEKIKAQEKRVEAEPGSAALRNDFGNLLAARGFAGDARKQYKKAMELDKSNFLAPYNLGLLEETQGDSSAAINAFEASIKRKSGFPPSRFHLGLLYERKGWKDRAVEQYARALQIDPSMRNPRRNPLAAETQLLDRASLVNYERDLAKASLSAEERYADEGRFGNVPADRPVFESESQPAPAPPLVPATPGPAAPALSLTPAAPPRSSAAPPPPSSAAPPPPPSSAAPPPAPATGPAAAPTFRRPAPPPAPTPTPG
jgi:tetratricopeptide (TPR) repeat protein